MRPLLQHASRVISAQTAPVTTRSPFVRSFASRVPSPLQLSLCVQCQYRASVAPQWGQYGLGGDAVVRRRFHTTPNDEKKPLEEKKEPLGQNVSPSTVASEPILIEPTTPPKEEQPLDNTPSESRTGMPKATETATPQKSKPVDNIARVPDEQLPSHREAQRWNFSKRLNKLMDELMPKIADMTQKVNTYTGTDYSGIEALKREIKEQEQLVKQRRATIVEAKQALDAAHTQAATSQKEVVALLERKHSWSAGDLERYMSLIRSEHVNDQAVREAKEAITSAENALEEARAQLEKRERAQYHEEQIWSDTIRRNSTWVTFGLMGVNIILLLASLLVFEPYRRKKIVREVKAALESHKASMEPVVAAAPLVATPVPQAAPIPVLEPLPEKIVPPTETTTQTLASTTTTEPSITTSPVPAKLEVAIEEAIPGPTVPLESSLSGPPVAETAPLTPEGVNAQETINIEEEVLADTTPRTWQQKSQHLQDKVVFIAKDIVSDRVISMRRFEYTSAMLQSAAAGAIITAALVGMFASR